MNILIAEDDFISRKLLTNILEGLGHTVFIAEDGQQAWNQYRTSPTRLVISDWRMPRMDGIQLVENIRAHPESHYTYIIMLTANVDQKENYYEAMRKGVDDFLAKPLDRVELEIRLSVAERILSAGSRIKSLEDVLTICAYTKKINIPDEGWQTIEEFMRSHLGITLTHGVEPDYYENVLKPEIERLTRATAAERRPYTPSKKL